jgi:aspartate/methionine/tyrosine aminotransferase
MTLELLQKSPLLRVRAPDAGYYVFVESLLDVDEESLVLFLLDAGVFVYPGYFFGESAKRYLAISCLVEREILRAGIEILVAALARFPR